MSITTIEKATCPTVSHPEIRSTVSLSKNAATSRKAPEFHARADDRVVHRVAIDQLRSHPVHREIYGDQVDADLFESIREHGVLEPLLVTSQNVILSGQRRRAASLKAGLAEVPFITVDPADENAAIEVLLGANDQRVKTNEEIAREAALRMKVEQAKAKKRQITSGANATVPAKSPEAAGDARAIVARRMGIGVKKVDQCVAIIEKLNALEQAGETETYDALAMSLKRSVNLAAKKVVVMNARSKHPQIHVTSQATEQEENEKPVIMTRIADNLIDGLERWSEASLLEFEEAVLAYKTNWFARNGKEAA